MSWRTDRAAAAVLLLMAGGCMDQGDLFRPVPERVAHAPRLRLTAESYVLYEGDRVPLRVDSLDGRQGSVEVLVLDRARAVVWRSAPVALSDSLVSVPVTGLPATVYGDTTLALSADLDVDGHRVYASDDTAPALSRDSAASRPVRFYPGAVLAVGVGQPQAFALDAATGRLFYSVRERARIGVLDLALGRETAGVEVPTGPVALRFRGGRLGALVADGTELMVFDAVGVPSLTGRMLLPTLRLDVQTLRAAGDSATPAQVDTLAAAVRPYAAGLAWGCADPACAGLVAFTSSRLAGVDATDGSAVMRRLAPGGGAPAAPLVVPAYSAGVLPSDTVPSRVRIFAGGAGGGDSLVFDGQDRMRCPTASLGAGPFDVAPGSAAVLYASVVGDLACGDGTRIMRIDQAAADAPRFDALARRNELGEDRIGVVKEIRVSPDGQYVLVRGADRVHLLDAALRLRATVAISAPSAIAWVEGSAAGSAYFAVAGADGVDLYDTASRTVVARLPLGPTREDLLAVWRYGAELVAAAAPLSRDGLVVARIPVPLN
ncbi:MAG TPA: hypothetical protein VFE05_10845 [Longimicrobiaceae bacterium]|jgi:hypothetical protein|nr:hypothetical protein [Longimicrobiaceae bacterium]